MSSGEDDFAFDNWEQAAEELEKQKQPSEQFVEKTKVKEQEFHEKSIPEEKGKKNKNTLIERIKHFKSLAGEGFEEMLSNQLANKKMLNKSIQSLLRSDKDFINLGKSVGIRIDKEKNREDAVDEQNLSIFMEELFLYLYNDFNWRNMSEIAKKVRIVKNERKADQKKVMKSKQKEKRKKKKQEQIVAKEPAKSESKKDDLFGGVVNINSKQVDEERKEKVIELPKIVDKNDDDDYFM